MRVKSLWVETTPLKIFPALQGNLEVDVAIVGGGITGLTAGILLQRAGMRVAIVDNGQIAMGETGYTTAHLTQILDNRYHQIISDFGVDNARLAAASKKAAIKQIESLIHEYRIACGFMRLPGYLYAESSSATGEFSKEMEALRIVEIPAQLVESAPLPFKSQQAIRVDDQAQFHPRQYLLPLAEEIVRLGGKIFELTRVVDVTDGAPCQVKTEHGMISAREVIISADVPVTNWLFLNTKISAYRSYALSAKIRTPIQPGLFWDSFDPYHYIRSYHSATEGEFLIVGGEDHKTGTKADTEVCFQNLERYVRERFEIEAIPYFWSGQIIKPLDGLPYIGVNSFSKHVYVSTGYAGNGMTFGTLGGMLLSDLILGVPNPWVALYDATRLHVLASAGNFIAENKGLPGLFIGDRLAGTEAHSTEQIQCNEGKLITLDGKKIAAYRSEDGTLHACSAVCPHMGCHVRWNRAESSWDCPCHGSRFDAHGKVLNGPSLSDLKPIDLSESADESPASIKPEAVKT